MRRALGYVLCGLVAAAAVAQAAPRPHAHGVPRPHAQAPSSQQAGNPLVGLRLFVDRRDDAQRQLRYWRRTGHPHLAGLITKIADEAQTVHIGSFTRAVGRGIRRYFAYVRKAGPGTVPVFATYDLPHLGCLHRTDTPAQNLAFRHWIRAFAGAIGRHRAVVFLEEDALITIGCLSRGGLAVRMSELSYATRTLGSLPGAITYLDAGAADGDPSPHHMANLLRRAGVANIRGFFLNSSHFDWTSNELHYGDQVARILHTHFVVSTGGNGQGPLHPHSRVKNGNEILCNPPGRGLGPRPTSNTGDPLADAFMWIGIAGRSDGACHPGDPPGGKWFPAYALELAKNANGRLGPGYPSQPY